MDHYIVSFPGLGIDNLQISPIAFHLFSFPIYWYGLLIAAAVLLGMGLALRHCERYQLSQDDILDALLAAIPSAIIGARLYYIAFEWDLYKDNLLKVFDTRSGGLAFYGGVMGGVLGAILVAKIKKIKFHKLLDFLIVYIPLGQALGRWGNFFNQEAFGSNTQLPWGMISNQTRAYLTQLNINGLNPNQPVHPTFLYEFLGNLLIFVLLLRIRKQSRRPYETFSWYLLLYGIMRFFVESVRTDSLYLGKTGIRVSQLLSALMVLVALAYLGYIWIKEKNALAVDPIELAAAEEESLAADRADEDLTASVMAEASVEDEDPVATEASVEDEDSVATEAKLEDEEESENRP